MQTDPIYPNTLDAPENVEFLGVKYRLMGARRYYLSQSTKPRERKGAKGLHVAILEAYTGQTVPPGHEVHHKDGNTFNNDPGNLEFVQRGKHQSMPKRIDREKNRRDLRMAYDTMGGREWHSSPEGIAWHREHARKNGFGTWPKTERSCHKCGQSFMARNAHARFCGSLCYERSRIRDRSADYKRRRARLQPDR